MAKIDDMKNPTIKIWQDCDTDVAAAVENFQNLWRTGSTGESTHTLGLITKFIDPALHAHAIKMYSMEGRYTCAVPEEISLSKLIQQSGFNGAMCLLKYKLRAQRSDSPDKRVFVGTLETLISLVACCQRKRSIKTKALDTPLILTRAHQFCQFCGNTPELISFSNNQGEIEIYPQPLSLSHKQKTRRLSSKYCTAHTSKLENGQWNPSYRQAKRSRVMFETELRRLSIQSCRARITHTESGNLLIDIYMFHYTRQYNFQPADEAELRNHARLITDLKVTDQKKQIVTLKRMGFNQSEIGRELGIARQQVSREYACIPSGFR